MSTPGGLLHPWTRNLLRGVHGYWRRIANMHIFRPVHQHRSSTPSRNPAIPFLRHLSCVKHGDTLTNRPGEQARLRLQVLRARAGAATVDIAAKSTANEQRVASEAQRDVSRSKLNEVSEKTSKTCFSDKAAGIIEAEMNEVCVRTESGACLEVSKEHVGESFFTVAWAGSRSFPYSLSVFIVENLFLL